MRSCRRVLLDNFLFKNIHNLNGRIIDIGGERKNNKGLFINQNEGNSWIYLNLNLRTKPDIVCSADSLPIANQKFDCFLLCEILEHLENPQCAINEAFRVTKKNGFGIVTMPFMYAKHGDPFDYQRWTDNKLCKTLEDAGFMVEEIVPMGGICCVICDLCIACTWNLKNSIFKKIALKLFYKSVPLFINFDKLLQSTRSRVTTGWAITVRVN